jgi:hypothetical protein
MIRIVNPRPGCAQFTSERAARKYVERRKIARWNNPEKTEIFLYHDTLISSERMAIVNQTKSAARRLGRISFWNGEDRDPLAVHRPGEVRC